MDQLNNFIVEPAQKIGRTFSDMNVIVFTVLVVLVILLVVGWMGFVISVTSEGYVGGGVNMYQQAGASGPTLRFASGQTSSNQDENNTIYIHEDPNVKRRMNYQALGELPPFTEGLTPYRRSPNDWVIESELDKYQRGVAGAYHDSLEDEPAQHERIQFETNEEDALANILSR